MPDENALRARLAIDAPKQDLSEQQQGILGYFRQFAEGMGFNAFPATPLLVASYLDTRPSTELEDICEALAAFHDMADCANPVATRLVREVLSRRLTIEWPRSWSKDDRLDAAGLDPITRGILLKRETQRDKSLRQAQNELAEQRKQLNKEAENVSEKTQ